MASKYIKSFVTGHGIQFEDNTRNHEAFKMASILWPEISSQIRAIGNSIVMFCGAKNNGKSSLLRYMVNEYNSKGPSKETATRGNKRPPQGSQNSQFAYYVDFDPGQPELTTAGLVSAHLIRASAPPLQSPTYLNVLQHEPVATSSVGGTNMSVNPRMFIDNCRYIFTQVREHRLKQSEKHPIFINTMGFIRNVGLAMLMDLIKICQPTDLIVLNIENDAIRTVYADLSPSSMQDTRASFYQEDLANSRLDYNVHTFSLQFSFSDSSSVASKNRTALQLAYLASIPEALYKPIMQLQPKWLSMKDISIYCVSSYPLKSNIVIELVQDSWVHLVKLLSGSSISQVQSQPEIGTVDESNKEICHIIDEVRENIFFGCGIVTGVDFKNQLLAIITPLSQEVLDNEIDCLIKPLSIQVAREISEERVLFEDN